MKFTAKIAGLVSLTLLFVFLTQRADASGRTTRQDGTPGFEGGAALPGVEGVSSTTEVFRAHMALRENNKMYSIYYADNGTVRFNSSFHSNSYVNLSTIFNTTNHGTTNATAWTADADLIGDINGDGTNEIIMVATNYFGQSGTWRQLQVLFYGDNGTIKTSGQPAPRYFWKQQTLCGMGRFLGDNSTVTGQSDTDAEQLLVREQNNKLYVINFSDNGTVLFNDSTHSNMYSYLTSVVATNEHATTNVADWQIDLVFDADGDGQDEILMRTTNAFGGSSTWRQLQLLFFADNATLLPRASQPSPRYYWKQQTFEAAGRFLGDNSTVSGQTNLNSEQILVRQPDNKLYTICFSDNGTLLFNDSTHSNMYSDLGNFVATTNHISTNASDWVVQGVGDVDGDGQDELLLRCTSTTGSGGQWSQLQMLFFADNGTIRNSSQPNPQYMWIQQSVQGFVADTIAN